MSDKFPRDVVIIDSKKEYGHYFAVGSIVTLLHAHEDESGDVEAQGVCDFGGGVVMDATQIMQPVDFAEIELVLEQAPAKEIEKEVAKRPRYVYIVQDEDGDEIMYTRDRAYARAVKAECGGKAAGVIIIACAEVKEIR